MTKSRNIGVVDYGTGNLRSVVKAFEFLGSKVQVFQSPDGIGEDSEIIKTEKAGAIFNDDLSDLDLRFSEIEELIIPDAHNDAIVSIAETHRNFNGLEDLYRTLLDQPK